MTVHTKRDTLLPRLPKDDSFEEQKQFNEAVIKTFKKMFETLSTDINNLQEP
jgi:hypothetical protein